MIASPCRLSGSRLAVLVPTVAVWLTGCVDGSGPTDLGPTVILGLAPSFQVEPSPFTSGPIDRIRLTALDMGSMSQVGQTDVEVDPSRPEWTLSIAVDLDAGSTSEVAVEAELFSAASVAWSGRASNVPVLSRPDPVARGITVHRGPLSNLDVVALDVVDPPVRLGAGSSASLGVEVSLKQGSTAEPVIFWASSRPDVATVTAEGATTTLTALAPGTSLVSVGAGPVTTEFVLTVTEPLSVATSSLPNAAPTVSYDETLVATGGDGSYAWAVSVGALPEGLVLDVATGTISGVPTGAGSTFTVQVNSGDGQSASRQLTLDVYDVLTPTTTSLPSAVASSGYRHVLEASGGDGAYAWTIVSGVLPSGLMLDAATGEISGTTASFGSHTFTVQVTSGDGQVASQQLTLVVTNLLGRWVDADGSPVTSAGVGDTVTFQLCYTDPDVAAFQADLGGFSGMATVSAQGDLDASGAGVHPDCVGAVDVLDSGFTTSGTSDPVTALIVSNAAGPGSGAVGIFELDFTLSSTGTLVIDIPSGSIVSSTFSGSALSIVQGIRPLTVN